MYVVSIPLILNKRNYCTHNKWKCYHIVEYITPKCTQKKKEYITSKAFSTSTFQLSTPSMSWKWEASFFVAKA